MKKSTKMFLLLAILIIVGSFFFVGDFMTIFLPKTDFKFNDENPVDITIKVEEEAKQFDEVILSLSGQSGSIRECKCILRHHTQTGYSVCKAAGYTDYAPDYCDVGSRSCPPLSNAYAYVSCFREVPKTPDWIRVYYYGEPIWDWKKSSNKINIADIINKECKDAIYCTQEGYDKGECTTKDMECSFKLKAQASHNYGGLKLSIDNIKVKIEDPCKDIACPNVCESDTILLKDGICQDASCVYESEICDDSDISTDDSCVEGSCIYTPIKETCEDYGYYSEVKTGAGPNWAQKEVDGLTCWYQTDNEPECHDLWWFDNDNKECGQKEFCGTYVYSGLRTFESKADCEKVLGGGEIDTEVPTSIEELTYSLKKGISGSAYVAIMVFLMIVLGALLLIYRKRVFT